MTFPGTTRFRSNTSAATVHNPAAQLKTSAGIHTRHRDNGFPSLTKYSFFVITVTYLMGKAHSPPCKEGVAAPLIKCCEATKAAQTGWSLTRDVSKRISRCNL